MFCPSFVQHSSLIDEMIRTAVVLFTVLMIHSAVAEPQVNFYHCDLHCDLHFFYSILKQTKTKLKYIIAGVAFYKE